MSFKTPRFMQSNELPNAVHPFHKGDVIHYIRMCDSCISFCATWCSEEHENEENSARNLPRARISGRYSFSSSVVIALPIPPLSLLAASETFSTTCLQRVTEGLTRKFYTASRLVHIGILFHISTSQRQLQPRFRCVNLVQHIYIQYTLYVLL